MVVNCPVVSLGISPGELDVPGGGVSTLTGVASLPIPGTPAYAWTATSGILADASAPTTTFVCTHPGIATVTFTAWFDGCSDSAEGVVTCLAIDGSH
jgi:hypothetical protein